MPLTAKIYSDTTLLNGAAVSINEFKKELVHVSLVGEPRVGFWWELEAMEIECPDCGAEVVGMLVPEYTGCANMIGQEEVIQHQVLLCKSCRRIVAVDGEVQK